MQNLKVALRKILPQGIILEIKKIRDRKYFSSRYVFLDNMKGANHLVYILAGYKPELYDAVFKRFYMYIPPEFDVCILSAGKFDEKLSKIAETYRWSYLATKKNHVPIIQNIAIALHQNAKYIWKFDEDMFISKGYFTNMIDTYQLAKENSNYKIGFVAPTVPINSFSYINFLKRTNKLNEYEAMFGKPFYGGMNIKNEKNLWYADEQMFLWECIENFDKLASEFLKENKRLSYSICPVRYSIGAIMYEREFWEEMGRFSVGKNRKKCIDGTDEDWIVSQCMLRSKAIVIADNVLVGHFAFGVAYNDILNHFKGENGEVMI